MIIRQIELYRYSIPFRKTITTSVGTMGHARNVLVRISSDEGIVGWGEASPFAPVTGDCQESCFALGKNFASFLIGRDPRSGSALVAQMLSQNVHAPSIRSAFDMAFFDLSARSAGVPLWKFLGGNRRELRTDLTIGKQSCLSATRERVEALLEEGFGDIKLKVGRLGMDDVRHVALAREIVGANIPIKIDVNQGWDYPTAVAVLRAMEPLDIAYVEQPLPYWDVTGLARLRNSVVQPICVDESVFNEKDAMRLIRAEAADYLNIKLGKSGGILSGDKINTIAEANGMRCMIGCFAESRLGLTAAAHLAMARPNIHYLDLDSSCHLAADPVVGGVKYDLTKNGRMLLSDEPGLGASMDADFLSGCDKVSVGD